MSIIFNELQGTINRIEQQKRNEIERAKQRTMQEVIIPFNTEIDTARAKAVAEITEKYNAEIAQIRQDADSKIVKKQQELADQKTELCEAGEKKKNEHSELALMSAELEVTEKFEKTLEGLRKISDSVKE